MRNMSGLVPYQNLARTAKCCGGPNCYVKLVYSSGFCRGVNVTCGAFTIGIASYLGIKWLVKQLKSRDESRTS